MMTRSLWALTLVILCSVYGCKTTPSNELLGKDRDAVIRALGQPYAEKIGHKATVLIYPRGPQGKETFFVELDFSGRVSSWRNVLDYENFKEIKIGMSVEQVERLIGPSLWQWKVIKDSQTIHNYAFHNSVCQIFQIAVLPNGLVAEAGFGFAPECGSIGDQ